MSHTDNSYKHSYSKINNKNIKNIKNNKNIKNINKKINKTINYFFKNFKYLTKSFTHNFLFWIAVVLSIIYLSKIHPDNSVFMGLFSFIIAMIIGWLVHYASHNFDATALYLKFYNYKKYKNKSMNPSFFSYFRSFIDTFYLHPIILNFFKFTVDFHDHIHHDTSINKQWHYILIEFIQNIFMEGGIIVLFSMLFQFSFSIFGNHYSFNHPVIWMWAFLYATVHNINYLIIHPECHVEHHLNEQTNFGIDTLDILFNTKFNVENIEIMNHAAINVAIITTILIALIKYKNNNPFILFFKSFL
jgi:hypothetical protein